MKNNINKRSHMTKAKNTRTLKTLKHIADNFGKEKRKSEKKEHLLDKILTKKEEELVDVLDEGESPMKEVMAEKEAEPAPEVTPKPLDVRPITKKFDGIKQNVVVFSGGFDSTLILVDLLEKALSLGCSLSSADSLVKTVISLPKLRPRKKSSNISPRSTTTSRTVST